VHVVIPTHTTRHLRLTLAGIAWQTEAPATLVVSCDTDDPAIGEAVARAAGDWGLEAWWVRRASHGEERLCQVRNNAARLLASNGVARGRMLVLDGDMVACPEAVALHAELGARGELVLPYRIDVPEDRTRKLDADKLLGGTQTLSPTRDDLRTLRRRDRRYRKHLMLRAMRLGPLHKPKLLGGHFSCDVGLYLELNGFDELYRGWGFKDDEFAFRAARVGARSVPACARIPAWHLFHPTRQPTSPMRELPTAERFAERASLPDVAEHGVDRALDQHEVWATLFGPNGREVAERRVAG